ncbi:MAG: MFS transporter [Candidatus Muproteobacteria bacterium RBG_16_62_13]|uniref:cytochrome-c oxidase n=1 Tax=Candidatus Muproteobacteria bacterium RBG_16_62_13 TaxID=1817756 RepID=A0A1F6T713_9PROT|nr:MAG: MFS transporter [Candidatus Muproteobacteria bacterium RBG_16_62_13]
MSAANGSYYLPGPSPWPVITSCGLFTLAIGFILFMNGFAAGPWIMLAGAAILVYMMYRWFGQVIGESEGGLYNQQVDLSFRWGMGWFVFSEVMFFAAFFGALFYVRQWAVPWLGDNELSWPGFEAVWPTAGPKGPMPIAPDTIAPAGKFSPMGAWGIPAVNTALLLSSGATITWAHWGLLKNNRAQLITGLFLTVALGITFLSLQAYEYVHAYTQLGLTFKTGIFGATFYILTGFHGLHVTIGTIMLITVLVRSLKGHFSADHHFGFEAVAWYWHFVDVVWLGLFIFVYWL